MRLLVAEDETGLADALEAILTHAHYSVDVVNNGRDALEYARAGEYDGMILDIMMPGMSGLEVLRTLRAEGSGVPALFLTAKSGVDDRILGLDTGADDYIAKPFRIRVLLARVAAALRRAAAAPAAAGADSFAIGTARIDARRFLLDPGDGSPAQSLSARELGLLRAFAAHPGEVLSRDELLDEVWGVDYVGGPRTLDQHVLQIRKKLGPSADRIETVHRAGYRYRAG